MNLSPRRADAGIAAAADDPGLFEKPVAFIFVKVGIFEREFKLRHYRIFTDIDVAAYAAAHLKAFQSTGAEHLLAAYAAANCSGAQTIVRGFLLAAYAVAHSQWPEGEACAFLLAAYAAANGGCCRRIGYAFENILSIHAMARFWVFLGIFMGVDVAAYAAAHLLDEHICGTDALLAAYAAAHRFPVRRNPVTYLLAAYAAAHSAPRARCSPIFLLAAYAAAHLKAFQSTGAKHLLAAYVATRTSLSGPNMSPALAMPKRRHKNLQ